MAAIGRRIAASVGWAGGIAIAVALLAFSPFAAVALVRLTGWEWGAALAAVLALNLVPLAGQIVTVGLAVFGAFTMGQDNLALRKAAPAMAAKSVSPPAAQATPAATDAFAEWKKNVAAPAIQKSCLEDVQRRGLVNTTQIDQMARACACYGAAAETVITQDDVEDGKLSPSSGFNEKLGLEARRLCQR